MTENTDSYGIYVHIPFCSQFCIYCDFYSVKQFGKREAFSGSLKREISMRRDGLGEELNKRGVGTIYFGGGTPSVLTASQLSDLLHCIRSQYQEVRGGVKEITVEANPDDVTLSSLKELKLAGFNRLSIGIQSFDDTSLSWMNRRHTAEEAIKAFYNAKDAGFENISIDLIFGYEMLSEDLWRTTIEKAVSLNPEHISAYQMGVEPGTPLYKLAKDGAYTVPDDEVSFGQYRMLQKMLAEAGYCQYEVSNYSKQGYESQHNSSYWNFTPYLGFGPSAHSFCGDLRSWNHSSVKRYIDGISQGEDLCAGFEILGEKEHFIEFIMLSLRTVIGIDKSKLQGNYREFLTEEFLASLERQKMAGNLVDDGGYIKIPPEKLFISDGIIRSIYWE